MQAESIPVLDGEKLRAATNGDPALQIEVLALFVAEAERLMRQVEDSEDAQLRGDRLRALVALARNTGALRLAHQARAMEKEISLDTVDLSPLRDAVTEAVAFVRRAGA